MWWRLFRHISMHSLGMVGEEYGVRTLPVRVIVDLILVTRKVD